MKAPKIFRVLMVMLSTVIFSSLALADSITLVDSQNPGVITQVTTTTSADGKTIGITFTNQSDPALKVGIYNVFFICSRCTPAQSSITLSDPSLKWSGPFDVFGSDFNFSSQAGFNLLTRTPGVPLQTLLNNAGNSSVLSGVTGSISLTFSSAFFPNGFSAAAITPQYLYQDVSGNWQRGVPPVNAPVPEPATLLLLSSGLTALGLKARRRKQ